MKATINDPAEVFTFSDVCSRLKVTRLAGQRMLREKCFPPPLRISPRRLRWTREIVERWIRQQVAAAC